MSVILAMDLGKFNSVFCWLDENSSEIVLRRQRAPKAITATAHKLARIVYTLMGHGECYMRKEEETYAHEVRARLEKHLHRRAKELGYELKKIEQPTTA